MRTPLGEENRKQERTVSPEDICVCCGAPVSEGRMVCWTCEHQYDWDEMEAFRPHPGKSISDAEHVGKASSGRLIPFRDWLSGVCRGKNGRKKNIG